MNPEQRAEFWKKWIRDNTDRQGVNGRLIVPHGFALVVAFPNNQHVTITDTSDVSIEEEVAIIDRNGATWRIFLLSDICYLEAR